MMNKFVLRFVFLLVSFFVVNISFGQELMDKIVEDACQEFEKADINENSSSEVINKEFEHVFEVVIARYADEIKEKFAINILEEGERAEKFGERIGIELFKKCPKFMEIAIILAQNEEDDDQELVVEKINSLEGTFLRTEEKGDFIYLMVKDKNKREHKLLWYEHFDGADQFINNPKRLRGKQVSLTYKKVEVYSPQIKDYRIVKQLVSLEFD